MVRCGYATAEYSS